MKPRKVLDETTTPDGSPLVLAIEAGHYMMIADVRGEGLDRRFQVADPWSGKNAWVSEAALKDGSFLKADFDMAYPAITHFYAGAQAGES